MPVQAGIFAVIRLLTTGKTGPNGVLAPSGRAHAGVADGCCGQFGVVSDVNHRGMPPGGVQNTRRFTPKENAPACLAPSFPQTHRVAMDRRLQVNQLVTPLVPSGAIDPRHRYIGTPADKRDHYPKRSWTPLQPGIRPAKPVLTSSVPDCAMITGCSGRVL